MTLDDALYDCSTVVIVMTQIGPRLDLEALKFFYCYANSFTGRLRRRVDQSVR